MTANRASTVRTGNRRRSARLPAAQRRAEILHRSAKLFQQRGYTGVSIDDIGADIGISGPALYRHVAGKEAILYEIGSGFLDAMLDIIDAAIVDADGETADHALDRVTATVVEYCLDHRSELTVTLRHLRNLGEERRSEIRARLDALAERVVPRVREVHRNLDADDAELYVRDTGGVMVGLSRWGRNVARPQLIEHGTDIVDSILSTSIKSTSIETNSSADAVVDRGGWSRASRREQILNTAIGLFRERGFRGVSMAEIAEAIGVTAAAPYRHFKNKEDILSTALVRAGDRIAMGVNDAVGGASTAEDAMERLIRSYCSMAVEYPDLLTVANTEYHHIGADAAARRRRNQHLFFEEWTHSLAGVRPDLTDAEATGLVGAVTALVNETIQSRTLTSRPGLADELVQLSHAVLRRPAGPRAS